jgi:hypothetical protein
MSQVRPASVSHNDDSGERSRRSPRQQRQEARTKSPRWNWTRLLKQVFAFDLEHCPVCLRSSLRIIVAITQGKIIKKNLRHLISRPTRPRSHLRVQLPEPAVRRP